MPRTTPSTWKALLFHAVALYVLISASRSLRRPSELFRPQRTLYWLTGILPLDKSELMHLYAGQVASRTISQTRSEDGTSS